MRQERQSVVVVAETRPLVGQVLARALRTHHREVRLVQPSDLPGLLECGDEGILHLVGGLPAGELAPRPRGSCMVVQLVVSPGDALRGQARQQRITLVDTGRTSLAQLLAAASGGAWASVTDARGPEDERQAGAPLTPREIEVLAQLANGATSKDVAAQLGITPSTVEKHRGRILGKLGAHSIAHALALASNKELPSKGRR